MEQLDTDIEYVSNAPRPSTPASRLSILYIFPILGVLLVLFFAGAFVFQWNLSALVDNLVVLMVVLFFVFIGIIFWATAPRSN
jgi:phosphoglycerol transferase MdoB-like AlkP superfamily enzyme